MHTEQIPARAAKCSEPAASLSAPVQAALSARGVTRLFTHQAQAIDAALAGAAGVRDDIAYPFTSKKQGMLVDC